MISISEARPVFDDLLGGYGFRPAAEHHYHESFGSAVVEYVRRGLRFRIIWDGRDGILTAEVAELSGHEDANRWSDLVLLIHGHPASVDEARAPERISHLRELADRFLAGRRSSRGTDPDGAESHGE